MSATKFTDIEKAEIVRLRGKRTSTDLAVMFQTGESTIRMIWKADRDKVGLPDDARPESLPLEMRFSQLTGMRVRAPQAPNVSMLALAAEDEPLVTTGKTLLDLTSCDCRWIIGKDEQDEIRYCAQTQCGDRYGAAVMYCAAHGTRARARSYSEKNVQDWINWTVSTIDYRERELPPELSDDDLYPMPFARAA